MKNLTLLTLALCLLTLFACKGDPEEEDLKVLTLQGKIECLSNVGLPNVNIKVEMEDGTAYELDTDADGFFEFEINPATTCYGLRIEKIGEKPPTPDANDVNALDAHLLDPTNSEFPAIVYDINRDQSVNDTDKEELEAIIGDLENAPNYPWTFVTRDGLVDLSCFTENDFSGTLEILGYRLSDFNGSDCE